jgi:hypothetical protein
MLSTLRGTLMHLNKDINYFFQFTNIEMKGLLLSSVIFGNWRFKCFHMFKKQTAIYLCHPSTMQLGKTIIWISLTHLSKTVSYPLIYVKSHCKHSLSPFLIRCYWNLFQRSLLITHWTNYKKMSVLYKYYYVLWNSTSAMQKGGEI